MLAFLTLFLLGIPLALLRGVVLSSLVGWFTPFHIGVVQAIGLTCIIALFTSHLKSNAPDKKPEVSLAQHWFNIQFSHLLTLLFLWGLAWVWHLFL